MNKNQYRIIFNQTRGLMMAVAEHIKSHGSGGKSSASGNPPSVDIKAFSHREQAITIRPLIFSVMLSLGLVGLVPNSISVQNAFADIVADTTAPTNQRPVILSAPNNVPVVNIQTPSAAGVSHNTYKQFDVNSNGVILNNSRSNVQTQLGGFIQGNPYLATGTARIILNEVNSSNPSYLNGYVEVAGSKAQVIIANPAGISCSGCGFINANRVTLTTGTPIMNAGSLTGYVVGGGQIEFLGSGLDTSQINYTDVIARAVTANAGLYAQNLNVITGTNQVNVDASGNIGTITPISPNATLPNGTVNATPGFAIDVAALGGMYAGKIHMIANEAGVGVRNAGNIGATAGEFSLTTDGQLINSGRISASTDVALNASHGIQNQGTISAQNNASLTSLADVQNNGIISAARELVINASTALDNSQGTISAQRLELHAASLNNTAGSIEQTGSQALSLNAQGITNTNAGVIGNLPIAAIGSSGSGGSGSGSSGSGSSTPPSTATSGGSTTVVSVAPVVLADGLIDIQGQINNDAGQIIANGAFDATVGTSAISNGLTNTGSLNLRNLNVTGVTLSNIGGSINVQQARVNTTSIDNTNGQIVSQDSFTAVTDQLNNTQGIIESGDSLALTANNSLNNHAGLIRASGQLQINSDSVTNTNTSATNSGIQANAITLNANQLDNTQGQVLANQALTITGHGSLNNSQGVISALTAVTLQDSDLTNKTQSITNTGGAIQAGTQLTIASNSLTGDGDIFSDSDLSVSLNQDYTHSANATLATNGNLTFTTQGTLTNQGELAAAQLITLNAANIDNTATAKITGENTHITASNTLNNRGLIDGGDTFINATTLNNIGSGRIYGDHIAIAAITLNNLDETISGVTQAATIAARDTLDIGATTLTNREHALLFSAGDIAIGGSLDANHHATVAMGEAQATTLNNNSATIEALGNVALNVAQINNTNEHITTQYVRTSEASTIANSVDVRGNMGSPTPATGNIRQYQMSNFSTNGPLLFGRVYNYDEVDHFYLDGSGFVHMVLKAGVPNDGTTDVPTFMQYNTSSIVYETQLLTTDPGQILAGSNMLINANTLLNDNSKVIAGATFTANLTTLNNLETFGTRSTQNTSEAAFFRTRESCNCSRYFQYPSLPAPIVESINLGNTSYGSVSTVTGTGTTVATFATYQNNTSATGASSAQTNAPSIFSLPTSSLFSINPNSSAHFLIETDPRFTNYRTWLSSDYLLSALNIDPATTQQRLGDGFYEQRLIREQVAQLTGRRYLGDYSNDETQYQALMNNGISYAQTYHLRPGIALSATQIAALTSDIVWLVAQTVTLPDGSTTQALVPQVYARLQTADLGPNGQLLSGALIAANDLQLNVMSDVNNSGSIAGRQLMTINANNINNLGGRMAASNVSLTASQDINNLGGSIVAADSLNLNAGRDINIASTTANSQFDATLTLAKGQHFTSTATGTNIDRVAGLYVTNPDGTLVAQAGHDLNVNAAVIANSGADGITLLKAGNDVSFGTVTEATHSYTTRKGNGSKGWSDQQTTTEVGSTVKTDGTLIIEAGHDLNTKAAEVTSGSATGSGGALIASAGNDINIESGTATSRSESYSKKKSSGFLSSKKTTQHDLVTDETNIASNLSGATVNLNAGSAIVARDTQGNALIDSAGHIITLANSNTNQLGGNINITGSTVVSDDGSFLNATNDITIESATDTHTESHEKKVKKSGFSASGASVTYGTSKLKTNSDIDQTTNVASTVGSINGDVTINAGNHYQQTGSDVLAPAGDIPVLGITAPLSTKVQSGGAINITAKEVDITAAQDTYKQVDKMSYKQTGITLAISSPVISAVQSAVATTERAGEVKDGRLAALYAAKTVKTIVETVQQAADIANSADAAAASGIKLSLSIGTSKSSSKTTQTNTTVASSTLSAGGDINITATGETTANGQQKPNTGNLNIIGSQLDAKGNISLDAANDINLLSAQNTTTETSKNKNSSANVGVAIGADKDGAGISVFANASAANGKSTGNSVTHTETTLNAGDTLSITSGHDTTLKGAIVSGNTVIADIGGNLNLQSEQDSADYKSKQSSVSGGISYTFGAGSVGGNISANQKKINSTYNSVIDQTAIHAGSGGFDINVAGNTDLKGAIIDSSLVAQQQGLNQLTTGTLTTSDIENTGKYKASGSSMGVNVNGNVNTGTDQPAGGTAGSNLQAGLSGGSQADSGEAHGTTHSAIATADITITNEAAQQTKTGQTVAETIANLDRDTQHANGSISNPFDLQKVEEQLEFLQLANELVIQPVAAQAAKWIGDQFPPDPEHPERIDPAKVFAHAVLGAAVSQLLGTGWQTGAAAGTLGDVLPGVLAKAFEKDENGKIKDEAAFKAANAILAAALISAAGADLAQTINAGMVTQNAVANNWLKHQEKLDLAKYKADCTTGNQEACGNALKLELLDKLRNRDLLNACVNLSPEACATQLNLDPAAKAYLVENFYTIGFGRVIAQFGENANKAAPPPQLTDIAISLIPVVGDVAGFAEAESPFDYVLAIIGALGPAGDAAKALVKEAKILSEAGDTVKAAEKLDAAQLVVANAARGKAFEDGVLATLNLPKNTTRLTETLPNGKTITVIPDALGRTIIEVKDVQYLTNSNQFRAYLVTGKPIDLVINAETRISGPLIKELSKNPESTIRVFDPVTKLLTKWKP